MSGCAFQESVRNLPKSDSCLKYRDIYTPDIIVGFLLEKAPVDREVESFKDAIEDHNEVWYNDCGESNE